MSDIEARLRRLEDVEAIRKLTAVYAHYVDKGWNGKEVDFDKLPSLFAKDAGWKCAAMGVDVKGIDAIVEMLRGATKAPFAMHSFSNPIIDIDGDRATGKWLLWVGINDGKSANEVYQSEDLIYTRHDGGWVIQEIDLHFGQMLNS